MLRIRIGETWKQNPRYRAALRALAEGQGRGFSPREIVDVLGIELDGVDLAEGLGEAALLDSLGALVRAARALASGSDVERVAFTGGRLELTLERDGEDVKVRLQKPLPGGVVCAHDFTLSPRSLYAAVSAAARSFLSDLADIHPALADQRAVRALDEELRRPPRRKAPPKRSLTPVFVAHARLGDGDLALRDDRRALVYRCDDGRLAWTLPGDDALQRLSDAILGHGKLPPGVTRDPAVATLRFGRAPPVTILATREALAALSATPLADPTLDIADADHPPVLPLQPHADRPTRPRPADVPTSGLRRLLLRPAWRIDAAQPRPRLIATRQGVLLRTHGQTELRLPDGSLAWRSSAGDAAYVHLPGADLVAARDSHGALLVLDAATGDRRARLPAVLHGQLRATHVLDDSRLAASDGSRVVCVSLAGADPWTFEPPRERGLVSAAAGGVLVVGTDRGELYGLASDGRVAWHGQSGLDLVDTIRIDPAHDTLLITGLDAEGRAAAAGLALANGTRRWLTSLDGVRPGPPAVLRSRLCVPFESGLGAVIAALDVADGQVAWRISPRGDGAATLTSAGGRLFVTRCGGGLVALGPGGRPAFHRPARDPDPALSPARPRPAVVEGGLVVVPAALVHVFDAASGRHVASVEPQDLAPESVALIPGPTLVTATREGLVEAWRSGGHLRLI